MSTFTIYSSVVHVKLFRVRYLKLFYDTFFKRSLKQISSVYKILVCARKNRNRKRDLSTQLCRINRNRTPNKWFMHHVTLAGPISARTHRPEMVPSNVLHSFPGLNHISVRCPCRILMFNDGPDGLLEYFYLRRPLKARRLEQCSVSKANIALKKKNNEAFYRRWGRSVRLRAGELQRSADLTQRWLAHGEEMQWFMQSCCTRCVFRRFLCVTSDLCHDLSTVVFARHALLFLNKIHSVVKISYMFCKCALSATPLYHSVATVAMTTPSLLTCYYHYYSNHPR